MKTNGTIWTALLIVVMWVANLVWGDALIVAMPGLLSTAGEVAAGAVSLVGLAVTIWAEVHKGKAAKNDNEYWTQVSGTRSVNWTQIPFWRRIL